MNNPQYIAAETLGDALKIKQEQGEHARVIAGGTDLILRMRDRVFSPKLLVDLRQIPLDTISCHAGEMRLGAYVTLSQVLADDELAVLFPALGEACRQFAGPPIRNLATLGGNIVNASPAADLVPHRSFFFEPPEQRLHRTVRDRLILTMSSARQPANYPRTCAITANACAQGF